MIAGVSKRACVIIALFHCVRFSNHASLSVNEQQRYKSLIEGQGLYAKDDDVEILTVDNFKSELYGQKHAWFVEFYNSWCGFCQRFAPSWKALASDIRGWKDLVAVGAIDCTNENNAPLCREYEIMSYPTLRYFHEDYVEDPKNLGENVKKGDDVNSHRQLLLEQMTKEQGEGRGAMYPNLATYTYPTLNHLYDNVPAGTKFVFLIFEPENSTMGSEVALDLHTVSNVVIRHTPHNNILLIKSLQITKLPFMVVVSDNKESQQFAEGLKSRESFRMAIKQFLQPKKIIVPDQESRTEVYTGKWLDAEVPDMSSLIDARERKALKDKIKKMGDVVFQMDLETALRLSLKREVSRVKTITGQKLEALVAYLNVLIKYFPLGLSGERFLVELRDKVAASSPSISGKEISDFIKSSEEADEQLFSSPEKWLACDGSSPEHRGYPCGLWKMFHYLTVSASEKNIDNKNPDPLEVLGAMEGYIKNFFGCADCAEHFLDMVKKKGMRSVDSLDSAVLWLWMAHNAANKRLAGDETEDPEYPKVQFPSGERCPHCKQGDASWNLLEVLKYLKHMYSSINVRYIGSDTRVLHSGLEAAPGHNSTGGGVFKKLDASMCFILYVASFVLIVLLIRLFLKRGYRKKLYVHDILGKV